MTTFLTLLVNLTAPIAFTAPAFVGVNIDTAALFHGTLPHRLDFGDAGLLELGKAFATAGPSGSTLRVGGSTAENTVFGQPMPPNAVTVDTAYWDQLVAFAGEGGVSERCGKCIAACMGSSWWCEFHLTWHCSCRGAQ
jgi:hypothetical protein